MRTARPKGPSICNKYHAEITTNPRSGQDWHQGCRKTVSRRESNFCESGCFVTEPARRCSGLYYCERGRATRFQPGDRVGGFLPGNLQEQGAFAEYLVVEESFSTRLPASMPFEYAATIGVAVSTAAIALFSHLNLPRYGNGAKPFNQYLLVDGGTSATGTMIIQIAKLSGARVIALRSPRNFDLVKSYGADKAFDYQHPVVAAVIRDYTVTTLQVSSPLS
ncbi:hypothetical protein V2G26_007058 [Clonostachys chloroleuca]